MSSPPRVPTIGIPIGRLAAEARPVRWAVRGFLPEGGAVLLAGLPKKARKTVIAVDLGRRVARGEPWLGLPTSQRAVFYNWIEGGRDRAARRAQEAGQLVEEAALDPLTPVFNLFGYERYAEYLAWFESLAAAGEKLQGLWIIDTLAQIAAWEGWDERDNAAATRFIGRHERLAEATGLSILILHHVSPRSDRGQMRGASALEGTAAGWCVVTPLDGEGLLRLDWTGWDGPDLTIGARVSRPNGVFEVRPVEAGLLPTPSTGLGGSKRDEALAAVRLALRIAYPEPRSGRRIARESGYGETAVRRKLNQLLALGEVTRRQVSERNEEWVLARAPAPMPTVAPGDL